MAAFRERAVRLEFRGVLRIIRSIEAALAPDRIESYICDIMALR